MEMKNRSQRPRGPGQQYSSASGPGGTYDFSDIFESFFGGREAGFGKSGRDFPGTDVMGELHISLQEAYSGTERILDLDGNKIKLKIKPGAYSGLQLRAKGKGQKGARGTAGDLYVKVLVQPHPVFERRGDDLYMKADISMFDALLGGQVEIVTLSGKVNVRVREGTQNGKQVRLKGKGMPVYAKPGQFGDLFLTLEVKLPAQLTPSQKELLGKLRDTMNVKT